MKYTVGIIGFGRFGKVLHALFCRGDFDIKIFSRSQKIDNKTFFKLEEIIACDLVFFAVPISQLETFLQSHQKMIAAHSHESALFADVCSVKIAPARWMMRYLPKQVSIVATHPIFGPVSSSGGTQFENLPFMLEAIRLAQSEKYDFLVSFLRSLKLHVIETTCTAHDQEMSRTQLVAFIMGTIGKKLKLINTPMETTGFKLLMENQRIVESDSSQLFTDMLKYNPFAKGVIDEIQSALEGIKNT